MPILCDELSSAPGAQVCIKDLWELNLSPHVQARWDELRQCLEPPTLGGEDQSDVPA